MTLKGKEAHALVMLSALKTDDWERYHWVTETHTPAEFVDAFMEGNPTPKQILTRVQEFCALMEEQESNCW